MDPNKKQKTSIFEKIEQGGEKRSPFEGITMGDVLWPIITFAVLVFLVIFVYVPFGLELPTLIDDAALIEEAASKREKKVNTLNSVNETKLDEVDTLLSNSLPDRFDVSVLASAVTNLAFSESLTQNDLTLRDEPAVGFQGIEQEGQIRGLKALTGVFSYRGDLESVNNFIDAIVKSSRIISIESFELKAVPTQNSNGDYVGDEWNIDITLKAYSFEDYTSTNHDEPLTALPPISKVEELVGTQTSQ